MNFRLRIAAWFGLTLVALVGLLIVTAHRHLDQELRQEKWERSHPNFPDWVLHGSFTDAEIQDILGEMMQVWIAVGIPSLIVALAVGYWLAERSIRPIRLINRQLSAIKTSALGTGVALSEKDPVLADLVRHINALLHRVGVDYEQMAGFSSKVADELRTPLMLLRMKVDQSALLLPAGLAEEMQSELSRLSRFVERSLVAAKAESGHLGVDLRAVDMFCILEDMQEGYAVLAAERGVDWSWQVRGPLPVVTDADHLRQILHNVLGNAVRYAASRIRVRAAARGDGVALVIANDTNPASMATPGIGLGLRLVRGLCEATQIRFSVRSRDRFFACRLVLRD
ncbi:MAG: HAMP domain-containing sensor histidine kinase [Terrimicrobiaceae bacterium]|nr:HAMP domain-containing sensor histidine kinase [Terrimicrobiaceae bacterium]